MTRQQAYEKLRESMPYLSSADAMQSLKLLETLGLVEFEPAASSPLEALAIALSRTVQEGSKILTAARVNGYLTRQGFLIVPTGPAGSGGLA